MTWLGRTTLGLALAFTALLVPATAHAITVECSNPFGTCEVSNDGDDEVFCDCDNGGTGSTGGNVWMGLDEEELQAVCFDQLEFCGPIAETEFGTSTFGTDTIEDTSVGVTTDPSETESATTSPTGITETESTTVDPTDSSSDSSSTIDPTIDPTDTGSTSGDTEGSSSSSGDGSSGSSGSTGDTDPSTSGTPVTMSGTETTPIETSDAESSGDTGSSDGDGGCSCSTDGAPDPIAALGVLALFGLRLRRRR
jgi:MYXO-CTERM domain-containing protein